LWWLSEHIISRIRTATGHITYLKNIFERCNKISYTTTSGYSRVSIGGQTQHLLNTLTQVFVCVEAYLLESCWWSWICSSLRSPFFFFSSPRDLSLLLFFTVIGCGWLGKMQVEMMKNVCVFGCLLLNSIRSPLWKKMGSPFFCRNRFPLFFRNVSFPPSFLYELYF